jgi:hypothetical protein
MSTTDLRSLNRAVAEANITVSIMGLAVSNFNESNKNWETIFLRDVPTHKLKIIINKYRNGAPLEDGRIVIDDIHPDERFFIRVNKAVDLGAHAVYDDAEKGLENVLDLTGPELYGGVDVFEASANRPFTFLSISDGIFYTQNLPPEEYEIKVGEQIRDVKRTADVTGTDIKCEIGGKLEILTVIKPDLIAPVMIEENIAYEIIFDNTCVTPPSSTEQTDYAHYNSLLKSNVESSSVALFANDPPENKTGACHRAIASDLVSFSSLSELLRPLQ